MKTAPRVMRGGKCFRASQGQRAPFRDMSPASGLRPLAPPLLARKGARWRWPAIAAVLDRPTALPLTLSRSVFPRSRKYGAVGLRRIASSNFDPDLLAQPQQHRGALACAARVDGALYPHQQRPAALPQLGAQRDLVVRRKARHQLLEVHRQVECCLVDRRVLVPGHGGARAARSGAAPANPLNSRSARSVNVFAGDAPPRLPRPGRPAASRHSRAPARRTHRRGERQRRSNRCFGD